MLGPLQRAARRAAAEPRPSETAVAAMLKDAAIQECFRLFTAERRWIDERHLELCRIPAPTFREQKRAEWMAAALVGLGWESKLDRAGNVVAQLPGTGSPSRLVALTAHLDTVIEPASPADIGFDERRRMTGPGVADNGAGLAALLAIARAVSECRPFGARVARLVLVANVGEEGEGDLSGMRFLCRPSQLVSRIASFLVLDGPSTEHITTEALACRRYEISITGPGGHSWSDHGAANPVHALSRAIAAFVDSHAAQAATGHTGRYSFNFGVIDGGTTVNAIPSEARAKVDLRSENPELLNALVAALSEALEEALAAENAHALMGRVSARRRETGNRPGGALRPDSPLIEYVRAVDAELGIRATPDCASTDANIPLSLGLEALSIGAGGDGGGAHTPGEWYSAEHRETGLRRILLLLGLMLGETPEQ